MPLCFDLDGTIGSFDGGYLLLRQALGDLWGEEPSEGELKICRGSTDWEIVDELHRTRFGTPLSLDGYAAYDQACLNRFQGSFHPEGRRPEVFQGLITGMSRLVDLGHRVWLVSGNAPSVLDFKAQVLQVDARVPKLGSLPHLDRAGLIRKALEGCPGPHLYVGDRPHDRMAAASAGVPFLGVGAAVPGDHPILSESAEADHLLWMVESILPMGAPMEAPRTPRQTI